jgi:L-alanine-DL-glutamate epimerase-like enolase superfamily enzyme
MRISNVEAIVLGEPQERIAEDSWDGSQDTVVIRVSTDAGITGLGEVDSAPEVVRAIVESPPSMRTMWGLRDLAVGEDPREIGRLFEKLWRGSSYYGRSGVVLHAISGVEVACWDILGQSAGLPVSTLLGGAFRTSVPVYASLMAPEDPAETTAVVEDLVAQGFRAIKFGGGPLGRDPDSDEALVAAARAGSADVDLMIDLGMSWETPGQALRMAKRLERYGLRWIEEPIWPDDVDAYVWLTSRSPVPIAAGEAESVEARLHELIERRAVDILQPDVTRAGGFQCVRRVVDHARQAGIECVLHCYHTGITKAVSLHLTAACRNLDWLEYCVEDNPIQTTVTNEAFPVVDGEVAIPTAPGLGVTLNEETIATYRRPHPGQRDAAPVEQAR